MFTSLNRVGQYLSIEVKDTFVKDDPKVNVNHPILITNLSQFDVIFKLKTNQPNYLSCVSNLSRIGPLESHKFLIAIIRDLQITWCKVISNQTAQNQQIKYLNTLLGKIDNENVGSKIITFKRLFTHKQDQNNINKLQNDINTNNQPQKSSNQESQKQINDSNQAKQREKMIQKLQQQNLKLRKQNNSLKSMVNNVPLSSRQSDLQMMQRISSITELIKGLMKPAGLMEVLVKIQRLSQEKIGKIKSQDKKKQIGNILANTTFVPQQVSTLQDAFYEFGIKLFKKIKQKQQIGQQQHVINKNL